MNSTARHCNNSIIFHANNSYGVQLEKISKKQRVLGNEEIIVISLHENPHHAPKTNNYQLEHGSAVGKEKTNFHSHRALVWAAERAKLERYLFFIPFCSVIFQGRASLKTVAARMEKQ